MRELNQTDVIKTELEKFIMLKLKSFDENTSSEDIYALTELVKVFANLIQNDTNIKFSQIISKFNTDLQKVNLP